MADDPLEVVAKLAAVLDELGSPYAVAGSLASSLYGVPRATNDADLVADLRRATIDRFVAGIENEFYVDVEMVRSAVGDHSSFNVLDQATILKRRTVGKTLNSYLLAWSIVARRSVRGLLLAGRAVRGFSGQGGRSCLHSM